MNLLQTIPKPRRTSQFLASKTIPDFRPGDTLKVGVGSSKASARVFRTMRRVHRARSNKGMGSNFTVRKISFSEGVERVFRCTRPTSIRSKSSTKL